MKNRFGISRCCCESGSSGYCGDACQDSYNSCPVVESGSLYASALDAKTNCGWQSIASGGASLTGANGVFEMLSVYPSALSWGNRALKSFVFDYRTQLGLFYEFDVEVEAGSNFASFAFERSDIFLSVIRDGGGLRYASRISGQQQVGTLVSDPTIRAEFRIGEVIRTDLINGNCSDVVSMNIKHFVDGSNVHERNVEHQFVGVNCFSTVEARYQGRYSNTLAGIFNPDIRTTASDIGLIT